MYHSGSVITALLVVLGAQAATIKSTKKWCRKDDPNLSECVVKNINNLIPSLIDGEDSLGIPILDPLDISNLVLSEKKGQRLNLALEFQNVKVKGIKNAAFQTTSKFLLKKKKVVFDVFIPKLTLDSTYITDGNILLLPIKGAGKSNLTIEGLKATLRSDFVLHKGQDGKSHLQLTDSDLEYKMDHFSIYMADLFNGDKLLGPQMNAFLNENWQDVLNEFEVPIRKTIKDIIYTVVNSVSISIPYNTIFYE